MNKNAKIFIVGGKNILGISLLQHLRKNGFNHILTESDNKLDLLEQNAIHSFFKKEKPEFVLLTPVKSGGINANIKFPAEFMYTNLQVQTNILHCAYIFKVNKLIFLGSSCVYPKDCLQPMKEEYLLTGILEKTSEPYALAKLAGIEMCGAYNKQYHTNFISLIPATVYGPGDNFNIENGHVLSTLIKKMHNAKVNNESKIIVWGTGNPCREFIYAEDLAEACVFLMDNYDKPEVINVGCGEDISIKELVFRIKDIIGFKGNIVFDSSKPDGTFRKLLDNSKLETLGWKAKISLTEGIKKTYDWFLAQEIA